MKLKDVITLSRESVADPSWLGSEDQEHLLSELVRSRAPDATVRWLAPGQVPYTKGTDIYLSHPDAPDTRNLAEEAEILAVTAFHEALHAAHSDGTGADTFGHQLKLLEDLGETRLSAVACGLFNALEDRRIARIEGRESDENEHYLRRLGQRAVEVEEARYRNKFGEEPFTTTPRSAWAQLWVALLCRIYLDDLAPKLDDHVSAIMAGADPLIAAAIASPQTDGARKASLGIVELMRRPPDSM